MVYHELAVGFQLTDRFTLLRKLGVGKSSVVFAALDRRTQTEVAVKILDPFLAQDQVSVQRFLREASIIRELDHPGVIKIFDLITEGQLKFIVMEYFPSHDGGKKIAVDGPFPVPAFLLAAKQIIAAVQACHQKRIVHRDLKPQNILFGDDARIKLVDFGISRMNTMSDLTKTGTILGTPEYMAPEAFQTAQIDLRGDIYSLGTIFYELLAGFPPYTGGSLGQIMAQQLRSDFRSLTDLRADVPRWLQDVIAKCLRASPDDRYQNCGALLADLSAAERALARIDGNRIARKCLSCKQEMLSSLTFCHSCGKFVTEAYEPGSYSIVLRRADRLGEMNQYLSASFPGFSALRIQAKLKNLPVLLLKGVSESTAQSVASELYIYPVGVEVLRSLPKEFQLSSSYAVLAACGLAPLVLLPHAAALIQGLVIALAEVAVFAFFAWKTVAVIDVRGLRKRGAKKTPAALIRVANELAQVSDPRSKAILGSICVVYQAMRSSSREVSPAYWEKADRDLAACVDFARNTSLLTKYLRERSVSELKKKIETVDMRLKDANSGDETAALISLKDSLLAEFGEYRHLQDRYAESIAHLLAFYEHLKAAEAELGVGEAPSQGQLAFDWNIAAGGE